MKPSGALVLSVLLIFVSPLLLLAADTPSAKKDAAAKSAPTAAKTDGQPAAPATSGKTTDNSQPHAASAAANAAPANSSAPATSAAANSAAPNGDSSDTSADYKKLFSQWQGMLSGLAAIQAQSRLTTPEQRQQIAQQFSLLAFQAEATLAQLQSAAEKAYAADDSNTELAHLLYNMAIGYLRVDNYEQALHVAKLLIDHHFPDKGIYRVAASAAFATMQLDDAKKYLAALGDGKIPPDPDLQSLAAEIEHYRPMWQREQKLRQAEAKTDDLPRVKLHTTRGDIVVELFENEAPNTVANFISLVEKHLYDGTQFHRVLPGFMAQGGDPLSKDAEKNQVNIGGGGPGYTIADECRQPNHREHFAGSLSMAHTAAPDSGGSQFFLTFAPTPHLDGIHTVFGRVIEGEDVLSKLQRINPDWEKEHVSGVQPDRIVKAEVLRKRNHPYEPKVIPQK